MTSLAPHRRAAAFSLMAAFASSLFSARPLSAQLHDDLVTLPPFEVQGMRPWLYTEFAGFQVLSLASEKDTVTIIERWQRSVRFTPLFFPASMPTNFSGRSTLFLQHFAGDKTVNDAARLLRLPVRALAQTVIAGDKYIKLPTDSLANSWRRGSIDPLGSHMVGVCDMIAPQAPVWYREALLRILGMADVSDTTLEVRLPRSNPRDLAPLSALFAVVTNGQYTFLLNRSRTESLRWLATAQALTHWGLFDDNGRRRPAFLELIALAGRQPVDDAMLVRLFGHDRAELDVALAAYARARNHGRLDLPPEVANIPLPPVLVRPATQVEVASISGELYVALGQSIFLDEEPEYRAKARAILRDAYDEGFRDPRLLAQLAYVAMRDGENAEALSWLETACSTGVEGPRARVALTLLRLTATENRLPLASEEAETILEPVRNARTMQPQLRESCNIAADIWMRVPAEPPRGELELLTAGARNFPGETDLQLKTATLLLRADERAVVRELLSAALAWPGNDDAQRKRLRDFAARRGFEVTSPE